MDDSGNLSSLTNVWFSPPAVNNGEIVAPRSIEGGLLRGDILPLNDGTLVGLNPAIGECQVDVGHLVAKGMAVQHCRRVCALVVRLGIITVITDDGLSAGNPVGDPAGPAVGIATR